MHINGVELFILSNISVNPRYDLSETEFSTGFVVSSNTGVTSPKYLKSKSNYIIDVKDKHFGFNKKSFAGICKYSPVNSVPENMFVLSAESTPYCYHHKNKFNANRSIFVYFIKKYSQTSVWTNIPFISPGKTAGCNGTWYKRKKVTRKILIWQARKLLLDRYNIC
jgi:hypothetical protein